MGKNAAEIDSGRRRLVHRIPQGFVYFHLVEVSGRKVEVADQSYSKRRRA
jgi:hypothetical protein